MQRPTLLQCDSSVGQLHAYVMKMNEYGTLLEWQRATEKRSTDGRTCCSSTSSPLTLQVALRLIPHLCDDNSVVNRSGHIHFLSRLYFNRSKEDCASSQIKSVENSNKNLENFHLQLRCPDRSLPLFCSQTLQLLRVTTSSRRHWIHNTSSRKTTDGKAL